VRTLGDLESRVKSTFLEDLYNLILGFFIAVDGSQEILE